MKKQILGLLVGGLTLAATASPAMAVKVTVEVEGLSAIVGPTVVNTPAKVSKDGADICPDGDNVLGALDAVTNGDWAGSQYGATRILAEDHPFIPGDAGWVFVVNGVARADYGCTAPVHENDKILWYASAGFGDFHVDTGFDDPVLLDAPTTAVPGKAFTVTATNTDTSYDNAGAPTGTAFSPSVGATISGGAATATTGANGKASVTVGGGAYALVVTKDKRAPGRIVGCATNGSDGFCGTYPLCPASSTGCGTPPPCLANAQGCGTPPIGPCVTNGNDGFCGSPDKVVANAAIIGVSEGKKYKKGAGPRELSGKVANDGSGVADVRLRLTRTDGRKCATYDGKTEKFKTIKKCGASHGVWFSVGAKQEFTYLLPSKLGRGRYVLDVEVTDKAGNTTKSLARGTSRVVFFVA